MYQFCHGSAQFCPKRLQFARLFTPCLPFLLLIAPSVTSKSKPCALLNGSHCTMYNGSKLNWPKKGICLNFHSKFAGIGNFECFENTLRSGMELVRNSAIYHSMGPLSSWPLLLTLISKKSGGRPTNRNAGAAGSTNESAPFSQQPSNRLAISWGAQQEGTGRDIALICAKGSFRDRMKIICKWAQAPASVIGRILKCWVFVIHKDNGKDALP